MKKLVLDHFRRWSLVLAIVALLSFGLGWRIAARPAEPFEFWALLLALWAGANFLSFDFKRGALRPIAALPMTGRQIAVAWWFATVPIPAFGLAVLLFLGAVAFCQLHPNHALPAARLAIGSLFTLMWLGTGFRMTFRATRGLNRSVSEMSRNVCISLLSMAMIFGSLLCAQNASKSAWKCALILGVGAVLTLAGWTDAWRFEPGRAVQFYQGRPEPPAFAGARFQPIPLKARNHLQRYFAPSGHGGFRFLMSTNLVRMFLYIASMSGLTALLWQWQSTALPLHASVVTFAATGSLMSCGFIVVFQLLPLLRQLRTLRTLPCSATCLCSVLISLVTLPLIALGLLSAMIAVMTSGTMTAMTFLNSYTFVLVPASLSVFLAVWLGEGRLAYTLLVVTLFGSQQIQLRLQAHLHIIELPLSLAGPIAGVSLVVAFLLTQLALRFSSRAYRARANPLGSFPLGVAG